MRAIEVCRTAALGGHVEACNQCDYTRIAYNSCRNRHCPKCQNGERAKWLESRKAELLPVECFHVVFTLPEEVARIVFYNGEAAANILFRTAAETLLTLARDPKHLGAEIGFFAVLHTWGQNLLYHPHVHCVVPGGGLAPGYGRWISCAPGFFLPVRVLSRLFRRLFLEALESAFDAGELQFPGEIEVLKDKSAFTGYLAPIREKEWVVYAKPPFGGSVQALEYLGRYTHRVALSNNRILDVKDGLLLACAPTRFFMTVILNTGCALLLRQCSARLRSRDFERAQSGLQPHLTGCRKTLPCLPVHSAFGSAALKPISPIPPEDGPPIQTP